MQDKSIILLGSGPKWQDCPFDKPVWAVAKMILNKIPLKRVDMLFNMDDVSNMASFDPTSPYRVKFSREIFVDAINKSGVPFVTSYSCEPIKNCVQFPLKEIYEKYGIFYFTNTVCFMIAYALYTGVESIDFWGIAQSGMKEYLNERRGVEFWIGIATGLGTKITINGPSSLLKHDKNIVYGYKKTPIEIAKEFGFYGEKDENLEENINN